MWEEQGRMKSREEGKEGRSCMQPQKYSNQRPFLGSQTNQMFYYMDEPNFGRSLHFRKKKTHRNCITDTEVKKCKNLYKQEPIDYFPGDSTLLDWMALFLG